MKTTASDRPGQCLKSGRYGAPHPQGSIPLGILGAGATAAFTVVEVMMGTTLIGIMSMSLLCGFSYGFSEVRLLRENLRATQILTQKMEVARLLTWDEVANLPGYVPTNFTAPYYASTPTNSTGEGLVYTGSVTVTTVPMAESYSNDLRMIQVQVKWTSGNVVRQKQMTTMVSQYGLQKYVY